MSPITWYFLSQNATLFVNFFNQEWFQRDSTSQDTFRDEFHKNPLSKRQAKHKFKADYFQYVFYRKSNLRAKLTAYLSLITKIAKIAIILAKIAGIYVGMIHNIESLIKALTIPSPLPWLRQKTVDFQNYYKSFFWCTASWFYNYVLSRWLIIWMRSCVI